MANQRTFTVRWRDNEAPSRPHQFQRSMDRDKEREFYVSWFDADDRVAKSLVRALKNTPGIDSVSAEVESTTVQRLNSVGEWT